MSREEVFSMINYTFKSIFAPYFASFIKMKAAMGFTTEKFEYIFKELDLTILDLDIEEPILTKKSLLNGGKGESTTVKEHYTTNGQP